MTLVWFSVLSVSSTLVDFLRNLLIKLENLLKPIFSSVEKVNGNNNDGWLAYVRTYVYVVLNESQS